MAFKLSHEVTKDRDGVIVSSSDVDARNKETEQQEIQWLQTSPDNVFLYVHLPKSATASESFAWAKGDHIKACCRIALKMGGNRCPICGRDSGQMRADSDRAVDITTWLGTPVATHVYIGPRRNMGFGYHSYRRPVSCRINGVLYHGWYMESSGDYCRLKKAKRQVTTLDRR